MIIVCRKKRQIDTRHALGEANEQPKIDFEGALDSLSFQAREFPGLTPHAGPVFPRGLGRMRNDLSFAGVAWTCLSVLPGILRITQPTSTRSRSFPVGFFFANDRRYILAHSPPK